MNTKEAITKLSNGALYIKKGYTAESLGWHKWVNRGYKAQQIEKIKNKNNEK